MKTQVEISSRDDVIDSRDIIERIKELESLRDDWQIDNDLPDYARDDDAESRSAWTDDNMEKWGEWEKSDEGQELCTLSDLQGQAEGYSDWEWGAALIRDSYFEDYARELAIDIGAIKKDSSWPCNCIDWERAAEELQMDYTSVLFDGVTYWVR